MSGLGELPVDLDAVRAVARDCGWTLEKLASSYLRGTARQIRELGRALADGDAAEVARLGHGGAGSSLTCGVPGMTALFREIEHAGDTGRLGEVPALLERASAELERVETSLRGETAAE